MRKAMTFKGKRVFSEGFIAASEAKASHVADPNNDASANKTDATKSRGEWAQGTASLPDCQLLERQLQQKWGVSNKFTRTKTPITDPHTTPNTNRLERTIEHETSTNRAF